MCELPSDNSENPHLGEEKRSDWKYVQRGFSVKFSVVFVFSGKAFSISFWCFEKGFQVVLMIEHFEPRFFLQTGGLMKFVLIEEQINVALFLSV